MLRLHSVHRYPIPHVHMDGSFIQKANNLPSNLVKHPFLRLPDLDSKAMHDDLASDALAA